MPPDGRLTVHVLDTATGRPAAGMALSLFRIDGAERSPLGVWRTNADGRCDAPLLSGAAIAAGIYEIAFDVAAWRTGDAGFYDVITIRFRIADPAMHTHIPLLLSPYGYTTYRGS
jgi:5-hydroxyisourate hydrolase